MNITVVLFWLLLLSGTMQLIIQQIQPKIVERKLKTKEMWNQNSEIRIDLNQLVFWLKGEERFTK